MRVTGRLHCTRFELNRILWTRDIRVASKSQAASLGTFGYVDHGGAIPYKGADQPQNADDYLSSVGFGIVTSYAKNLTARITFGVPLSNSRFEPDPLDVRTHFFVQLSR